MTANAQIYCIRASPTKYGHAGRPAPAAGSGGRFRGQTLEKQQVEPSRLTGQAGQDLR
jgi:hypothetical protein